MQGKAEGVDIIGNAFYAEGGGQAGELGDIQTETGVFEVQDTKNLVKLSSIHGVVKMGSIRQGQSNEARVALTRQRVPKPSATHLLHAALREHLGTGVTQRVIGQ